MPTDLRHSALSHAVGDVLQDVSELVQKELQFARAELASNLDAVVWKIGSIVIAAVFALVALLSLTEAAIFALVAIQGMPVHLACLAVGGAAAAIAIIAYVASRSRASVSPTRTLHHVSADIQAAKEHLT
jgi:Putative Actinobacterial Holin-X, holin superfamily III